MKQIWKGSLSGAGQKHALLISRWNDFITTRLLDGAHQALNALGVSDSDIDEIHITGSFELGPTAVLLAKKKQYTAITCLGCVIQGSTPHFEHVCAQTARLIAQASYDTGIPVIFGVLTTNTIEQAIERAGSKAGNKGYEAASNAVEMANLYQKIFTND